MQEWLKALIIGVGSGLFFVARKMEKRMTAYEDQVAKDQLEKSENRSQKVAASTNYELHNNDFREKFRTSNSDFYSVDSTYPQLPTLVDKILEGEPEKTRQKFRTGLNGIWSSNEIIPIGCSYNFRENGTGIKIEYGGFGGWEIPFQWRSVGDWSIEIKFDYPAGYWESFDRNSEVEGIAEDKENEWEKFNYDFIVANLGYGKQIVLCSAYDAQRFQESHEVIRDGWFGFDMCDGPLTPG